MKTRNWKPVVSLHPVSVETIKEMPHSLQDVLNPSSCHRRCFVRSSSCWTNRALIRRALLQCRLCFFRLCRGQAQEKGQYSSRSVILPSCRAWITSDMDFCTMSAAACMVIWEESVTYDQGTAGWCQQHGGRTTVQSPWKMFCRQVEYCYLSIYLLFYHFIYLSTILSVILSFHPSIHPSKPSKFKTFKTLTSQYLFDKFLTNLAYLVKNYSIF